MAATIEDDASLDDDDDIEEGNNDGEKSYVLPNFMPAARDIMWRFPCTPGAAGAVTELASSARSLALSPQREGCGLSSMRRNCSLPVGTRSICFENYTFIRCTHCRPRVVRP
jgi:hypothetical protein